MRFNITWFDDYRGELEMATDDGVEFTADVDSCYDGEEWNDESIRSSAEAQVKAHFGQGALIIWE